MKSPSTRQPSLNQLAIFLFIVVLLLAAVFAALPASARGPETHAAAQPATDPPPVRGPFVSQAVYPSTVNMGAVPEIPAMIGDKAIEIRMMEPPQEPQRGELFQPAPIGPQAEPLAPSSISAGIDFAGLDFAKWGTGWPPDPNGDVGPNHYVQAVNNSVGIFDKSGTRLKAVTLNDFFDGTNSPCDAYSKGDPIVLYDSLADRWLITDMSWQFDTGPYYQCLALSASGDPLGDWYQWGYLVSYARWNDYSKMGVWTDGYYLTANMFQYFDSDELNTRVIAFDRETMLVGGPMRAIYFDLTDYDSTNYYTSLLPANLRGPLPPTGSPEYFATLRTTYTTGPIRIWEFAADWDTPANSTFTGPTNVTVPSFDSSVSCGGDSGRECVPQKDTSKGLHAITNKLLMQLQYRNFGAHESLWANHTVGADASGNLAGIRWYEVRDPGGTPTLHQSGTKGGTDSVERWMGSLAVDGQGDMALGYSASNSSSYPSIRYAGRLAGDTLGSMQAEQTMITGTGSQASTHRWGDYTAMTIDPVDDCTFWYTNEYYTETNTSMSNWQTRVGSFKFTECTSNSLHGAITDASTTDPIAGAQVKATHQTSNQLSVRTSDSGGAYQMPVSSGTYTVTATAYGYQSNTVAATVNGDTVANIALTAAAYYDLSGVVTDSNNNNKLRAHITVLGDPLSPPAPDNATWSDASDGSYSLNLASGIGYTLLVEAAGYASKQIAVAALTANTTQDIALDPDLVACNAPGYQFVGIMEDFEVWPPEGWEIGKSSSASSGLQWDWNGGDGGHDPYLDGNYTGGSGFAATVNSDRNAGVPYKTWLRPPRFDLTNIPATLTYRLNYQDGDPDSYRDKLSLSIRNDTGSWHTLVSFGLDHGELYNVPGELRTVDLSSYSSYTNAQLSWYYSTSSSSPHNWYAQVDEVRIGECQPIANAVVLEPETIADDASSCAPQTYALTFVNNSTFDDTVDITYAADAMLSVSGPTTLGVVSAGSSASFDVTVDMNGCQQIGDSGTVTVTATLAAHTSYHDATTIDQRAVSTEWEQRTGPFKQRSDQAFIATDDYLYQIAGTSSTTSEKSARYVYRYDPADDSWLTVSSVITPVRRIDGAAIDNKIYILGGLAYDDGGSGEYTDTYVQIYNEATDTWSSGAQTSLHRSAYAAVAVGDKIYRIGGRPRLSGAKTTVSVYDTAGDTWTDKADYPWSVMWPCAGAIDGKIYVAGGTDETNDRANTAVYDPTANTWNDANMADLPVTLYGAADFVLDGKLYCAGGVQDGEVSAATWVYDPDGDAWTREADLSEPRFRLEGDALGGAGYVEDGWDPTYSYSTAALERTKPCETCLTISKTVTPTLALPGDTITYTLSFSNTGIAIAGGIVITDNVPVSITNTSVISSGVVITQHVGQRYVWDVADMDCKDSGVITIAGVLDSPLAAGIIITNTATISTSSADSDSSHKSSSASLTVGNAAPVAVADTYSGPADAASTLSAPGVLVNDSDANGDALTAALDTAPPVGTFNLAANGAFDYTPAAGFTGVTTFTYHASDSVSNSSSVTSSINIIGVDLGISSSASPAATLSWTIAPALTCAYDVYASTAAYNGYTLKAAAWAASPYVDNGAIGDPATNHFYYLDAVNCPGTMLTPYPRSNTVGEFDFALLPGSP